MTNITDVSEGWINPSLGLVFVTTTVAEFMSLKTPFVRLSIFTKI